MLNSTMIHHRIEVSEGWEGIDSKLGCWRCANESFVDGEVVSGIG